MPCLKKTFVASAALTLAALASLPLTSQGSDGSAVAPVASFPVVKTVTAAAAVAALKPATPAAIDLESTDVETVRAQLKTDTIKWGGKPVQTLDEASRILLAQAAAEEAGLHEVGLTYEDVYGIIEAETSWVQRTGASKDGTPNLGLAQFEPRTAKAYGIEDPSDPVQAVYGAARYMRDAAEWASGRVAGLKLSPEQHALKVREGVSIYYNLSIKGRNKWDGQNADELPVETQRHIRNARAGAQEARQLVAQLKA
ncbi:transglycosylase SLT domain-containing protein [Ramlibacter albus]|uniref:Transglycosylase SLT domain-containing protein n=1 Tax=Ramlibacter albus TaxID=2079448 RepID=A0A923S4D3_9BURK|nr:transglycosylase SLT domain-containing protein [Ramlibacter albus]MBC5764017.1 hypothetical protein [Ramlibacter albus]